MKNKEEEASQTFPLDPGRASEALLWLSVKTSILQNCEQAP